MESFPRTEHRRARPRAALIAVGAAVALVGGLAIGWAIVGDRAGGRPQPAPAAGSGLVIDSSGDDQRAIDPAKPLRCFVDGQFVGELSLSACAQRNGVATDALDVGLDPAGALSAADQAGQTLAPLPPAEDAAAAEEEYLIQPQDADPGATEAAAGGNCWKYGGGRWRKLATDVDINACVQALFADRCEKPGGATYGRWGQETLRRIAGRVEVSDDNRTFRMLVPQAADCSLPPVG